MNPLASWDPLDASEEEEPTAEVTLTDPRLPGGEVKLLLQRLGETAVSAAEDYIDAMVKRYVTGDPDEGVSPQVYQHKGKKYRLNRGLIRTIVYVMAMQKQEPKFEFPWYLGIARNFSSQFRKLRRAGWDLMKELVESGRGGEEIPNPFGSPGDESEDGSFDAPLPSDNGTPTSKRDRTTLSAASLTP